MSEKSKKCIPVREYVKQIPIERHRVIFEKRLSGMTSAAIAREYGVTKERISQILRKCVQRAPELAENVYLREYCAYDIPKKDFMYIFGIDDMSYNYLHMCSYRGHGSITDLLADPLVGEEAKKRAQNVIHQNEIYDAGEFVDRKRSDIVLHILKTRHRNDRVSVVDLTDEYNEFCIEHGFAVEDDNANGISNMLARARNVLMTSSDSVRYYDMDGKDLEALFAEVPFGYFKNMEISAAKLFDAAPELMAQYDIRNSEELHNLIRKNIEIVPIPVVCGRMPTLTIGKADRFAQMRQVIEQHAPKTEKEAAQIYEQKYGFKANSISGSKLMKVLQEYYGGHEKQL